MKKRVLAVVLIALAGTLLAASTSPSGARAVAVIDPIPPSTSTDGGH